MQYAADTHTDSATININIGIISVRKHISSMQRQWNSKQLSTWLREQLKLSLFSSPPPPSLPPPPPPPGQVWESLLLACNRVVLLFSS